MQNVIFRLLKNVNRPVAILPTFYGVLAMIDTGSIFPVWCGEEDVLQEFGAKKVLDKIEFGGFGGVTTGKLYQIPVFNFGGLIFPHMNIILHEGFSVTTPLILPATIFNNLIFEINNKLHTLKITIPDGESNVRNFIIREEGGHLRVLVGNA